jgi:hypothetical protein
MPSATKLSIVKDAAAPHGMRISSYKIFGNPTGILVEAVKRGMMPKEAMDAMMA